MRPYSPPFVAPPYSVKNPAGLQMFANRLRLLRQARGYSQQQLADIANVEQSTIKRIELRQLAPPSTCSFP